MPRRFRLPEGTSRRLILAAGVLLPFFVYFFLRTSTLTRPRILHEEAKLTRQATRFSQAVRFFMLDDAIEENKLYLCNEENKKIIEELATLRSSDIGPMRTLPIEVVARAYEGDTHRVLVWEAQNEPFVIGEGVGAGKILFGIVVDTKKDLAVVESITSEKSAIPAMISGKEETIGIAKGTGGAWIEFAYVPKGSAVAVGDILVSSGLGGSVVRGLVLGTIREVIDEDPSPFYRIRVEPIVESDAWWEGEIFHIPVL